MKINLEEYLKKNRPKLDVEFPDQSVWNGINAGITNNRTRNKSTLGWKVAAIFLFLISATYVFYNETKNKEVIFISLSDISSELKQQETEFQNTIGVKWQQVQQVLPSDQSDFQFLFDELNYLETINTDYKSDLSLSGANEQIIRAMLDYYEKKIQLLDRLLMEAQKQQDHEDKNNISL